MKKTALILCAALMALVSCNKQLDAPAEGNAAATEITFNLDATHPAGGGTKAVKTGWETGDVIFVFIEGQTAPAYLEMKWNGSTWDNTSKGLSAIADGSFSMRAVYLPFGSGATVSNEGTSFIFKDGDKKITYLSYYFTDQKTFTVSDGAVSGTFNMRIPEGYVQFFLNDASADSSTEIELREPHLTPQGIASIAADGSIVHTEIAHGAPLPGYVYKKEGSGSGGWGFLFSGILAPEARNAVTEYHFTKVLGGWKGSYSTRSYKRTLYQGEQNERALLLPSTWNSISDYKPIDLGCDVTVDGVKKRIYWCSRNLGAAYDEAPAGETDPLVTTRGAYYAWGETASKTDYTWSTYTLLDPSYEIDNDYRWKGITKYTVPFPDSYPDKKPNVAWYNSDGVFIGDNKTVLEPEDDAARKLLGGLWRIPTEAEWEALNTKPTFDWIWADINKGIKVYSNVDGYMYAGGPYIYLPAISYWKGTEQDPQGLDGYTGLYWTASLYELDVPSARYFFFNSTHETFDHRDRFEGLQIRAVTD